MEASSIASSPTDKTINDQASAESMAQRRDRTMFFLGRSAVVGLLSGLLAVAFKLSLEAAETTRHSILRWAWTHPTWGWSVLPAIGLLIGGLVGWTTRHVAPEAAGSGIPHLKGVLVNLRVLNWRRVLPIKFFGGVLGIGAGLSLGREGPTVQMGAAIGQAVSRVLHVPKGAIGQLQSAGAGAGLAAAFNAPLAGLIFVIEELHRELSPRTATGALVASVTATVVAHAFSGDVPSFETHGLAPLPIKLLPFVVVFSAVCGLLAVIFNRSLLTAQTLSFRTGPIPRWMLPGFACAIIGLLAWWIPSIAGGGHALAASVLARTYAPTAIVLGGLVLLKLFLTALSYGSGAPGGIFAPMLLLGALTGTALAIGTSEVVPSMHDHVASMAVLGMGAFFVASVRAPLTGIVLISEMTGGYTLLFPLCVAALVANLLATALRDRPIYEALLEADLERNGGGTSLAEPQQIYIGVQSGSDLANRRLADSRLPKGCLVTGVERAGRHLHPSADLVIRPGDHLTILYPGDTPNVSMHIVHLCTGL